MVSDPTGLVTCRTIKKHFRENRPEQPWGIESMLEVLEIGDYTMPSSDNAFEVEQFAMRSTFSVPRIGRSIMPSRARVEAQLWRPNYGIVFNVPFAQQTRPTSSSTLATEHECPVRIIASDNQTISGISGSQLPTPVSDADSSLENLEKCCSATSQQLIVAQSAKQTHHDLPLSESTFRMMEDLFRAAKDAEPGSPQSFWSHTLYRGPAIHGKPTSVKIHYCRSKYTTERTLQYFISKKVLGFDIEWKPEATKHLGAKHNVSLIQLASEDRIALFHIALFPKSEISDLVAPSLKQIMEDPGITKVGVAIKADCTRLRKYLNIEAKGLFELSHLYKLVKFSQAKEFKQINKRLVSLSTQVQEHLHLPIFKGEAVRGSDWSQPLKMDQILYAAADSYAAIHLFDTLELKRKSLDPTPPRPYHAEENKAICFAAGVEIATEALEEPELEDTEVLLSKEVKDYRNYAANIIPGEDWAIEADPSLNTSSSSAAVARLAT